MEKVADRIAGYFIRSGVAIEDNRDIYVYGLTHLFSHGISLVVTITIGIVFSIPLEMLIFFIPFVSLRVSAGGYHAKSFWKCIIASSSTIISVAIILSQAIPAIHVATIILILIASLVIVFRFAPIEDDNRPLTTYEVLLFRKRSRLSIVLSGLIIFVITAFGGSYYAFCAALGIGVATTSIFIAFLVKRVTSNEL